MKKSTLGRKLIFICALLSPFLLVLFRSANGQEKALIEAARKEGKIIIFGSLQDEVMKEIQASFDKKYPEVKSVYWRASTTAVMDRAINEFRTGKVTWDVFFTGVDAMEIMRNEGMFLKYQTPAAKNFDSAYHHDFYSPNYRSSIIGLSTIPAISSRPTRQNPTGITSTRNGTAKPPCPTRPRIRPWLNGSPVCIWC